VAFHVLFLQSFLCFATLWQFFILSNLAATLCTLSPHLFYSQKVKWSGRCFVNHNPAFHVPIVMSISFCRFHCGKHLFLGRDWSLKTIGVGCWSYDWAPNLEIQNFIVGFTPLGRCRIWLLCLRLAGLGDPAGSSSTASIALRFLEECSLPHLALLGPLSRWCSHGEACSVRF
jgi:hypothetical protein